MFGETLIFDDNEAKKNNFHRYARPFNLDNFIVEVSKKINYFENNYKYFIGNSEDHGDDITLLDIALPQTTAYVKSYDTETK